MARRRAWGTSPSSPLLFFSLICWLALCALSEWSSVDLDVRQGVSISLGRATAESNASTDAIQYAGTVCDEAGESPHTVLLRPDMEEVTRQAKLSSAVDSSYFGPESVVSASLTLWINRMSDTSDTLEVFRSAGDWGAATTYVDGNACCTPDRLLTRVPLADVAPDDWQRLTFDVATVLPTWISHPLSAGFVLRVQQRPGTGCVDSRVAVASFYQPPAMGEYKPALRGTVRADGVPPKARVLYPSAATGGFVSRDDVWLYLAVEEHESGLSHFECALSNDPAQQYRTCPVDRDNPLKINLKSVKLPAGAWSLLVRAVDRAGNQGSTLSVPFKVDDTSPVLQFMSPPASTVSGSILLQMTVSDTHSGAGPIHCGLNPAVDVAPETLWGKLGECPAQMSYSNLPLGRHVFVAVATDRAGNKSAVLRHEFTVSRGPEGRVEFLEASREAMSFWVHFTDPVDSLEPRCVVANVGFMIEGWLDVKAMEKLDDGKKWSVQGVPGARILQHLAAAPVSVLVQHHCLVARAGGRVVAHGETPIPVDLRPIQCSGAGPAHADLGQPFTARFDVSKAGVVPASLERLLVEASAGQEAGRVLDIRVEDRQVVVTAVAHEAGDAVVKLLPGSLLDKLGNTLNADCVTRPVTVHRGGRLSTSSSGVLHLGNVAGSAGVAVPGSRVASHLLAASFGNRVAQPVADGDGVAVAVHTLSGRPLWLAVGTLERVSALAVGPSGDVLVADGEALTLALLGADGQLAARAGPALQSRPLESFDDLVDEALGAAARRGEGEGEGPGSEALLRSAGSSAPVPSEGVASLQEHLLESVSFVHADARGFWYVGETAQGRVVVLDEGLALVAVLARWGCEGQEAQGAVLGAPVGVAVDGRGRVWVADRDAGLVIAFDSLHDFSPVAVVGPRGHVIVEDLCNQADLRSAAVARVGAFTALEGVAEVDATTAWVLVGGADGRRLLTLDTATWRVEEGPGHPVAADEHAVHSLRFFRAPELVAIGPEGGSDQSGPFRVSFTWSEAVEGFDAEDVHVGGIGGTLSPLATEDGITFTSTVSPRGVGALTLKVLPGSVTSLAGLANLLPSDTVRVRFSGGRCAAEMSCQWSLAFYEHELAMDRLRVEATLQKQAMVAAEMEAARVRVQEERALGQEREAQERRLGQVRLEADAARESARVEAERQAALARADVERQLMEERLEQERLVREMDVAAAAEKAKAEAAARVAEKEATQHLELEQIKAQGATQSGAYVAAVLAGLSAAGKGLLATLSSPTHLRQLAVAFGVFAALYFSAKETARVVSEQASRLLSQPPLVRETTVGWLQMLRRWARGLSRRTDDPRHALDEVILPGNLHSRMAALAKTVAQTKAHGAPFRHVLLYGPPGTGKTMAATRLARGCVMDYAVMSGGDVLPLGTDAVQELNKLFAWAKSSRRGLVLFIDEADAFLRKRGATGNGRMGAPSENLRAAINALLAHTGTQQSHFMMVLASNRPQDLDDAVMDRIDETVGFPKPALPQREAMLRKYFREYIGRVPDRKETVRYGPLGIFEAQVEPYQAAIPDAGFKRWSWEQWRFVPRAVRLVDITDALFKEAAIATDGFSGREMAKLMAAVQAKVYCSQDEGGTMSLDARTMLSVIRQKVAEHGEKEHFMAEDGNPQPSPPLTPPPLAAGGGKVGDRRKRGGSRAFAEPAGAEDGQGDEE